MIYYIKNEQDGAYVYPNRRISGYSALTVIKKLCLKHLTTLEGYIKSVKPIIDDKYKIPVVLSHKYAFFSTKSMRDYDSIWINYMAIKEIVYLDKNILFIFDEKYQLSIKLSTKSYQKLVRIIIIILKYKKSLE
ncbi:competence protein ComK [Acholeplasma granularum]|uniref:competence protein ComK n=1 Tax=Acholeplasma granularum TaxID=264635 RepID=UPI0004ADA4D8|nr:competence protein ComK [Acholeplasma granularum]